MQIQRLYLKGFRNYTELDVTFSPEVNLICGDNAQGKTNLLEALYVLGTGRSFRTYNLKELIHQKSSFFFIEAEFKKDGWAQTIKFYFNGQDKKLKYNSILYTQFTPLLGVLPIILMAPEDIKFIIGAPSERRHLLDLQIAQIDPLYVYHVTRYYQALKQRNFLLREKNLESVDVWEALMLCSASYIQNSRKKMVESLQRLTQGYLYDLSDKKDIIHLKYLPSLTQDYTKNRQKELIVGTTLLGPHRDEVNIEINGRLAKTFASQGQIRTILAAVKIAQCEYLQQQNNCFPLFCIDDFGVHLDSERQKMFFEKIHSFGQVFLTSPKFPFSSYHTLVIKDGATV